TEVRILYPPPAANPPHDQRKTRSRGGSVPSTATCRTQPPASMGTCGNLPASPPVCRSATHRSPATGTREPDSTCPLVRCPTARDLRPPQIQHPWTSYLYLYGPDVRKQSVDSRS